jgi:hypothetical protein
MTFDDIISSNIPSPKERSAVFTLTALAISKLP